MIMLPSLEPSPSAAHTAVRTALAFEEDSGEQGKYVLHL